MLKEICLYEKNMFCVHMCMHLIASIVIELELKELLVLSLGQLLPGIVVKAPHVMCSFGHEEKMLVI